MNNRISSPQSFSKIRFEMASEALAFLSRTTKGISNWNIYYALLNLLCVKPETIIKRGIQVSVVPGQVEACANSLRAQFNLGQKAMVETLNRMHRLGLINWHPSKVASLAEMTSVLGWYDSNGEFMENSSLCSGINPIDVYESESMSQPCQQPEKTEIPQEAADALLVETPQSKTVESLHEEESYQESSHEDLTPASDAEPAAEDTSSPSSGADIPENTATEDDLPESDETCTTSIKAETVESENAISKPSAVNHSTEDSNSEEQDKDLQSLMRQMTGTSSGFNFSALQMPQNCSGQKPGKSHTKSLKDKRKQDRNKA